MNIQNRPKVGVAVLIFNDNKLLLGKRKNAHGAGEWATPGGHLEFGETVEACAIREVLEEAGITIKNIRKVTFTNDIFHQENKHYITCFLMADYKSGNVTVLEPEKCEQWCWFSLDQLPTPLFMPIIHLLQETQNLNLKKYSSANNSL